MCHPLEGCQFNIIHTALLGNQSRRKQPFYPYSEWIYTERRDRYDESHLWARFCLLALDLTLALFP